MQINLCMRRTELTTRNTLRSRIQNIAVVGSSVAVALAVVIYAGVQTNAVGEMTPERQRQVYLQPQEAEWTTAVAGQEFQVKRKSWESRLLQLRKEKRSSHPDAIKAERLVPLYLKAEDASRRLSMIQAEDASLIESLQHDLSDIQQQLSAIETRTD